MNTPDYTEEQLELAKKKIENYKNRLAGIKLKKGKPTSGRPLYQYCVWNKLLADNYSVVGETKSMCEHYKKVIQAAHDCSDIIKGIKEQDDIRGIKLAFKEAFLGLAPYSFHHYLVYMEWEFENSMKFYSDRICVLGEWAKELEKLEYGDYDILGLSAHPRTGKAQPLYSKVLTPDGWKRMGDIKTGDKVIAADGKPCNVTDVFPQGVKDTYRVIFDDDTHTDCAGDHLWTVQSRETLQYDDYTSDIKLTDMLCKIPKDSFGKCELKSDYYVPCVDAIQFSPALPDVESRKQKLLELLQNTTELTDEPDDVHPERIEGWYYTGTETYPIQIADLARSLGYWIKVLNSDEGFVFVIRRQKSKKITEVIRIDDTECQCIVVDHPQHLYVTDDYILTHNSGIETYYLSWLMGRHPDKSILFATHTNQMAVKVMGDVINLLIDEKRGWSKVFPGIRIDKSAEYNWIDLSPKEYPNNYKTIYFRGIDSSFAGVLEASWIIVCDDLIRGIEEALNPSRLDTAWQKYGTDISQRRTSDQVRELHIATRWSVNDVLSKLEDMNSDNPRAKFIKIPGLNENGESNFMYKYHPMTKKHFEKLREHMDDVSFECIVQQNPMERDGILFPRDTLSYYEGILPDGEPDEIVFAADIAFGGGDYLSMPIAYVYGMDVYIHDVVHSNGAKETTKPMVVHAIIENKCTRGFMEANNAGSDYATDIGQRLKDLGYRCLIESKFAPNTKANWQEFSTVNPKSKGASQIIPDTDSIFFPRKQGWANLSTSYI